MGIHKEGFPGIHSKHNWAKQTGNNKASWGDSSVGLNVIDGVGNRFVAVIPKIKYKKKQESQHKDSQSHII